MYYPHFGLKEPPFKITPNTDFFFSGGNRGAVLDALVYAITNGEGIIKVVGEVGSGKTMLCRMLQTILPEKIESIYLANPSVAPEDVLHAIAFELQLKLPKNADRLKVMQALQAHLLSRHKEGRQVVIFVEEAQGMPLATLEEIRLLSNLETKQDKLLQIVLFGQPELDTNLNQPHIRQLRERITHSFHLGPLQTKDIGEYLIFRLRAAGYYGPHLFTDEAIKKISAAAQGLVRRVNILAEKSLLAAYAENVHQVSVKHVNAAIQDSEFGKSSNASNKVLLSQPILIGIVLIALLLALTIYLLRQNHQPQSEDSAHIVNQTANTPNQLAPENNTKAYKTASTTPQQAPKQNLLESRLEATRTLLQEGSPERITLQLMTSSNEVQVREDLDALSRQLEVDKLYVYQKKQNGANLTVFLYGAFSQRVEAVSALQGLPNHIKNNRPQLRTLAGINKELEQSQ
ncbi:MAG: general secretion pathway protein [Methylotenera sp.]|nr:MAG: general secretion pathway protein [Methylotenera sp.]